MDLQTNSELIQFCLEHLKLKKEEFIRNYKPTDWELLTPSEKLAVSKLRTEIEKEEILKSKFVINHTLRRYHEWLKTQDKYLLRQRKYTEPKS